MKTISLNLPDSIELDEKELSIMLAVQLYDRGKLTLGQSANLVGLTKEEFMDTLGKYGVSIFGESMEDIERDLRNG